MAEVNKSIRAEQMEIEARPKIVGARVRRLEDRRLLTGAGCYSADIKLPNTAHLAFWRSNQAHARITRVDLTAALALKGVIQIFTFEDLKDLVTPLRAASQTAGAVSTPIIPLASGKVRHVGEPVVAVVAESRYLAEDAVGLVNVVLEPLPVAVTPQTAAEVGAPLLHDEAHTNVLIDRSLGRGDVEDAFAKAATVVGGQFRMTRKTPSPIECRVCVADWNRGRRELTLYTSTQVPGIIRDTIAEVFSLTANQIRVVALEVGGGFGGKGCLYPDEMTACAIAIKLGRPVKWVGDRLEELISTYQAFDEHVEAHLAFDADGQILGLRASAMGDAGAYSIYPWTAAMEPVQVISFMPGPYRVPAYRARTRAVATPKTPMGAYRGVGRPAATFVMERLIDLGARKLGLDPLELRRRNLVRPDEFPYKTASDIVWNRVGFTESLEAAVAHADYAKLRIEQSVAREAGRFFGIGFSCYGELTGIGSRISVAPGVRINTGVESACIRIDATGSVTASFGIASHGQGYETTLAQVVAQELGCRVEDVLVLHGDSNLVAHGSGTFASRGAVLAGGAATLSARSVRKNVLQVAAQLMEVAASDLDMAGGKIFLPGTDKQMTLRELARTYYKDIGRELKDIREQYSLEATKSFDPYFGTSAAATHLAVVEIDPVTWGVKILKYVVAEDCGRIINPMIVEGQVYGGVAQGVGAALLEEVVHDEEGQVITGSLVDYVLPSAVEIPFIEIVHVESENPDNLTGFRGMGEGGTIGAPAAIANAVADALSEYDVDVRELPITPKRIFHLVEEKKAKASSAG